MRNEIKDWSAKWIGRPNVTLNNWRQPVLPAPFFRKTFTLDNKSNKAKIFICGLGYYELYLNGRKVNENVLDPVVTQYDKRVNYLVHNLDEYLVAGENIIGVILGNGWYNCHSSEVWHFDKASWRDYPKLLLQLEIDNKIIVCSDSTWKVSSQGPIVFDSLRNGETYDARRELEGWLKPDYNDRSWEQVAKVAPPGGILQKQTMPSCKVMKNLQIVNKWKVTSSETVYDLGQNLTGWVKITVSGKKGSELVIKYGEKLDTQKTIDQTNISRFNLNGEECQTDHYILKGEGDEQWEPRFTYHGFQYVSIKGDADIKKIEGRLVHTAFAKTGKFSSSNENLNKLQECTVWSYLGNFTGIPTDCPHREKNGWTGDAHLATETGLFNFGAGSSYNQWIDSIADTQRPSGQLPGIVPCTGWGYNWGSGPAWDSAFLLIPWYIYLYTANSSAIERHYTSMKKYVDYCSYMATDNIVSFGLGDWCHHVEEDIVDVSLTSTAYYYVDTLLLAKFASLTGRTEEQKHYSTLAKQIKKSFNNHFYNDNGTYAKGEMTALGCALYQELVVEEEKSKVASRLEKIVKANNYKPHFGILGAKYIPRALADNGYVETAYKLLTQDEFPGWFHWLKQGATTLWESWDGKSSSRNHIMFGDVSAWMYQYLGGITPDPENPGFKHIIIKPHQVKNLDWVKTKHKSNYGEIISNWEVKADIFSLTVSIPEGATATVIMPNQKSYDAVQPGTHSFQ